MFIETFQNSKIIRFNFQRVLNKDLDMAETQNGA